MTIFYLASLDMANTMFKIWSENIEICKRKSKKDLSFYIFGNTVKNFLVLKLIYFGPYGLQMITYYHLPYEDSALIRGLLWRKHDFAIGVKWEGQDTSRHFAGCFRFMHALLPMWGLGAKNGAKSVMKSKNNFAFQIVRLIVYNNYWYLLIT